MRLHLNHSKTHQFVTDHSWAVPYPPRAAGPHPREAAPSGKRPSRGPYCREKTKIKQSPMHNTPCCEGRKSLLLSQFVQGEKRAWSLFFSRALSLSPLLLFVSAVFARRKSQALAPFGQHIPHEVRSSERTLKSWKERLVYVHEFKR